MRTPAARSVALRAVAPLSVVLLGALSACGGGGEPAESTVGTIRTAPPETTEPEIPVVEPTAASECPYLSLEEASQLNGVPATDVRIDDRIDPVACFFYGADGEAHLTTTVYTVDSAQRAAELVEESVPSGEVDGSEIEGGWSGGRTISSGGALLAVSHEDRVLAVQSTRDDPATVQQVAELVAPRLDG
ncbi:MAG TPA: DUF2020 domain-containing protein [Candidatus Dietzia intestinipullorum]|nr:DUF2020 domain-containing protein [Candidatus Dietzia intestinipullorum]